MALPWPWSVPRVPFSCAVRPNSLATTTTSPGWSKSRDSCASAAPRLPSLPASWPVAAPWLACVSQPPADRKPMRRRRSCRIRVPRLRASCTSRAGGAAPLSAACISRVRSCAVRRRLSAPWRKALERLSCPPYRAISASRAWVFCKAPGRRAALPWATSLTGARPSRMRGLDSPTPSACTTPAPPPRLARRLSQPGASPLRPRRAVSQ